MDNKFYKRAIKKKFNNPRKKTRNYTGYLVYKKKYYEKILKTTGLKTQII